MYDRKQDMIENQKEFKKNKCHILHRVTDTCGPIWCTVLISALVHPSVSLTHLVGYNVEPFGSLETQ